MINIKFILSILFILPLFVACSSDDDNDKQDYTSFVVVYNADIDKLPNCVVGYKKDNKYYKIASLGDLTKGIRSKEITISDNTITEVYIFTDYISTRRFDDIYKITKNKKNTIEIKNNTKGILVEDATNPEEYPQ